MAAKLCNVCETRRPYTGSKGLDVAPQGSGMCNYCYEEGTWENSHNDEGHGEGWFQGDPQWTSGCWICHPELNLAQQGKGTTGAVKVQGTRRPQLNHKGHSHPQTPAARRACKKAFWTVRGAQGVTPTTVEAKHFAAWDFNCDGHGKPLPVETVKPADGWVSVAPRGPKGGVINQLKAGKGKPSN